MKAHDIPVVDKSKVYKFTSFNIEIHQNIVMVDLFDKDYNRYYLHVQPDGVCIFEVMSPRQHLKFTTQKSTDEVKSLDGIKELLQEQDVQVVFDLNN